MPFAASLLLDSISARKVERLWTALAEGDLSRSMLELDYPPHITLGIYEHLDIPAAISALEPLMDRAVRLPVHLNNCGVFSGEANVLYLTPASNELASLHRRIHGAVGGDCHPHYLPGSWVPHCTLATGLSQTHIEDALALVRGLGPEIIGTLEAVDLVRFSPVKSVWRRPLGPDIA